uniref:type IV pilin protein n=1 Tax=Thaumasiovibrio occultus TaxID=1891184 RepID=UPI000B34FA46|nr:type IV pilin protein [Thaumasiovibrio occultus]
MKQKGVTLIELLVVVVVIGVMASIAYPSYTSHVMKSNRSQAQANMVQMQFWAEKQLMKGGISAAATTLDSTQCPTCEIDNAFYDYKIEGKTGDELYVLTATPKGTQLGDECSALTMKGNGDTAPANCW